MKLINDDCLNAMKDIADKSIDLILTDLPYNTVKNKTVCKWDSPIDLDKLWIEYKRIMKDDATAVLFAQQPFTSKLILSNIDMYKYNWIWMKQGATNFLNSHHQPMKITEDVCVFSNLPSSYVKTGSMRYNPQMEEGDPYCTKSGNRKKASSVVRSNLSSISKQNSGERFPLNIIYFPRDNDKFHPTQKPVDLLRYFIRTYTNEGDIVLDSCMGSGSTGVACVKENRDFIGIEKDIEYGYFDIAKKRINEALQKK